MKKKGIFLLAGVLVLGILASALQTHLKVQTYKLESSKITSPVRLAVITDLHSTIYGENQEKLVASLEAQNPDAILLSGDIADDEVPHDGTKQLLDAIGDTYPCFYVSGNHEHWSGEYEKIAEMIAKENRALGLITGESIGQVASQTLQSLAATNAVCTLPVYRPVIGFDKNDIVEISEKIGAFETSIQPFEDCCTIFVAKHPVTKPNIRVIERSEHHLADSIDAMMDEAVNSREVILCEADA